MADLFLPLRSNAGWFETEQSASRLLRRLKNYLVLYDKLHIQEGRFVALLWEGGAASFWGVLPHESPSLPFDSLNRRFKPGTRLELSATPTDGPREKTVISSGPLKFAFEADFRPLLKAKLSFTADAVEWVSPELTEEQSTRIRVAVNEDLQDEEAKKYLPEETGSRRSVIEALHSDAFLAQHLGLPFAAEAAVERFVTYRNRKVLAPLRTDGRDEAYTAWVRIGLPDFAAFNWDTIWSIRESRAGGEFRRLIDRVSADVQAAAAQGATAEDQQRIAESVITRELIGELTKRKKTAVDVLLSMGLNLLPGVGNVASLIQEGRLVWREQTSWVALLRQVEVPSNRATRRRKRGIRFLLERLLVRRDVECTTSMALNFAISARKRVPDRPRSFRLAPDRPAGPQTTARDPAGRHRSATAQSQ